MIQKKEIFQVAMGTGLVLLLPLVGTIVSAEVNWKLADFVVAAMLLISSGLAYRFMAIKVRTLSYRLAVGVAVAALLLLAWMNLAVGLLGNEENPANLMYVCVFAVGAIGAIQTHCQPQGMTGVMCALALIQSLITVIAVLIGIHRLPGHTLAEILNLNGLFVLLFIVSALLFRKATERITLSST